MPLGDLPRGTASLFEGFLLAVPTQLRSDVQSGVRVEVLTVVWMVAEAVAALTAG